MNLKALLSILGCITGHVALCQADAVLLISQTDQTEIFQNQCFIKRTFVALKDGYQDTYRFTKDYNRELKNLRTSITSQKVIYHDTPVLGLKYVDAKKIAGHFYIRTLLAETAVCPIEAGTFTIPSSSMTVADTRGEEQTLTVNPVEIQVKPIPEKSLESVYTNKIYRMVGDFRLYNSNPDQMNCKVGDTLSYSLRMNGDGISNMISIPENNIEGIRLIMSETSRDTIRSASLRVRKTFNCKLIFTKAGVYDLSEIFSWNYYSLKEQKVRTVKSGSIVHVKESGMPEEDVIPPAIQSDKNIIAIDLSESMLIEDFKPNRRLTVGRSLGSLYDKLAVGPRLIFFAGHAAEGTISEIDSDLNPGAGTAIGSAIMKAIDMFEPSENPVKQLIIVGDGDNTSGFINPEVAAELAKEYGITIYSIGIGTEGLAPLGVDEQGRPRFIEDTYQSTTLRKIAKITGGAFHEYVDDETFRKNLLEIIGN